jgi:hypothetical protein
MDDVMHDEFMSLLCQSELGDDPEIWCIKAAASAHFKYSDTSIALQLIQNLPSLLLTNFGFQKLALTFRSLGPLIIRFPDDSLIPMFFLWPALLSVSHQNQMLRRAALKLLARSIPWALDHGRFADINGLHTTRFISQAIVDSVSIYEESVGVSFSANFGFALVKAMTRSLEEVETRKAAVTVLKTCIKRCAGKPQIAAYFALGFLAYAQEDPQSILAWVPTKSATVAAFIFKDFETRMADDTAAIVRYLGQTFGSRHCAHRLEVIADCLVYGATRYPECLKLIKTNVIRMCWQLMDTEFHGAKAEMIAGVCGTFFALPDERQAKVQLVGRIGDDALARCITGAVDGVAAALQLNLQSVRTRSA